MDLRLLDPRLFRVLASRPRAQLLRALGERPHTPAELARRFGLADATIHYHLARLAQAGLAARREDGRAWSYHELTPAGRALMPLDAGGPALAGAVAAAAGGWLLWLWRDAQPDPSPAGTMPFPAPVPAWAPWALAGAVAMLAVAAACLWAAWRARPSSD
jgi:DNA-binding transcriptional ArsR family regulator